MGLRGGGGREERIKVKGERGERDEEKWASDFPFERSNLLFPE